MDARSDQGFPSSCRLRTSREYTQVWRNGRRLHSANLLVIVCAGSSAEARLGISVSRKVGNAVCRNRIKRWIREHFRRHRAAFGAVVDLSIVAKPGLAGLDHAAVNRELQSAFAQLRIYADA